MATFILLAGRIAFGSAFLLPYDEGFHLGIIKIYSQHLNPFLAAQPVGGDPYGALARDPSYLYHYLSSFPYRLIAHFVHSDLGQVYVLRGINIALGLLTLYLVYRLARRLGLSRLGAQLVSLGLALTPVFYDVAAQINYDNLLLPVSFASVLLALRLADAFREKRLPVQAAALFVALVLFGSLVKFTYLPIGLAAGLYVLAMAIRNFGVKGLFTGLGHGFRLLRAWRQVALVVLVLLAGVAWGQRYGVNLVRYHTPVPDCGVVLSAADCSQYGIWNRDHQLQQTAAERPLVGSQIIPYTKSWARSMYYEVYSLVSAKGTVVTYTTQNGLRTAAKLIIAGGAIIALRFFRAFVRRRSTWLVLGLVALCYLLSLWQQNYAMFMSLHAPMAVQGRYLLPVLPFVYGAAVVAYEAAFDWVVGLRVSRLYAALSGFIVVCWLAIRNLRRMGQLALGSFLRRPAAVYEIYTENKLTL